MTNSLKPDSDLNKDAHSFDGITFEVEEEEHTHEGQKVKRRGIYLWPKFNYNGCTSFWFLLNYCQYEWQF